MRRTWIIWVLVAVVAFSGYVVSPALTRTLHVGTGFAAKRLCSEVFVAGREADEVIRVDLGLLPVPLTMRVDEQAKTATVSSPLALVRQTAAWRQGLGCALTYGTTVAEVQNMGFLADIPPAPSASQPWPRGSGGLTDAMPVDVDQPKLEAALEFAFVETQDPPVKRTRAVVIIYDGKLVAERYAAGFGPQTPLLGWSMSKSVTQALVGALALERDLQITSPAKVPEWQEGDRRQRITVEDLLRMSSGLDFGEDYGAIGSATKMLFISKSAAHYAAKRPVGHRPGRRWYYSSGDSNILARLIRTELGSDKAYHRFPRRALFNPIGARTAVFETDPAGNFVGSSFVYMSARDWARFGQLYLQDGVWQGKRVLPEGWAKAACTLTRGSDGLDPGGYGAQWWLNVDKLRYPDVPEDFCAAQGFEKQRVILIPSRKAVIVRLGLTQTEDGFDTNAFVAKVLEALPPAE